jgi:hypothetical protein
MRELLDHSKTTLPVKDTKFNGLKDFEFPSRSPVNEKRFSHSEKIEESVTYKRKNKIKQVKSV